MMLTMLLALARMQWRRYQRSWQSAKANAVARGVLIGPAPLGYDKSVVGTKPDGSPIYGKLVPNDDAPAMVQAFELAAQQGPHAAHEHLAQAFPDRTFKTLSQARRELTKREYVGELSHGDLVNPDAHEPLVSLGLFTAAQRPAPTRAANGDYPLSGIARCTVCGSAMTGSLSTSDGRKYRRMRCSAVKDGGHATANADKLEQHVRAELRKALASLSWREAFSPEGASDAERALAQANADIERWTNDDRGRDLMGDSDYYAGLEARAAARDQARDRYQAILAQADMADALPLPDELDDPDQFERALRAAVTRIEVTPGGRGRRVIDADSVRIVWNTRDGDDAAGVLAA
jgi:hypothetical protein